MKLGIISDVHSNIQALKAILNEFGKQKVNKIICTGDIIGIGINPEETVQELIKRKDMLIAIKGNHEKYLLNGIPNLLHDDKRKIEIDEIENLKWNHKKLSESSIKFLEELEEEKCIEIEGKKILIVHYPANSDGAFKKHIKSPSHKEAKELFERYGDYSVYLFGHTHTYFASNTDGKWYINVGSLGCPLDTNLASAGILEVSKDNIKFKHLEVEYNVNEIIDKINNLKIPHYKVVLKLFYGK